MYHFARIRFRQIAFERRDQLPLLIRRQGALCEQGAAYIWTWSRWFLCWKRNLPKSGRNLGDSLDDWDISKAKPHPIAVQRDFGIDEHQPQFWGRNFVAHVNKMQHHHHVSQADVLRVSHPHYVERLTRHLFKNNPPALVEVNKTFSRGPMPQELKKPPARNLIYHPPH